ncbi:MAG TPA: histidine phosphatase family protein [Solimonas sp.]
MRKLTIVRHAKASWGEAEHSDFERPLHERGRRDAQRMAAWAQHAIGIPDRIISSPALRAITTARSFAETFGIDEEQIVIQPRIYEASLSTLMRLLRGFDNDDFHIMLFGHNPGLSELACSLAHCPFDDLPTCAVVQLAFAAKEWQALDTDSGELLRYLFPKQLTET